MAAIDDISDRLEEFKSSGLIADFELVIVDDSIRVRIVPAANQDAPTVKAFVADAFEGVLSQSQIAVEEAPS